MLTLSTLFVFLDPWKWYLNLSATGPTIAWRGYSPCPAVQLARSFTDGCNRSPLWYQFLFDGPSCSGLL